MAQQFLAVHVVASLVNAIEVLTYSRSDATDIHAVLN
jgi:hypothetical protein